jgi:hypothetical protein
MKKDLEFNIQCPVMLRKRDGALILTVGSKKMKIPKSSVRAESVPEDAEVTGLLKTEGWFEVTRTKSNETFVLSTDDGGSLSHSATSFEFDGNIELMDFLSDPNFYVHGDPFEAALVEILNRKVAAGEYEDELGRDGLDWDEDEEDYVYEIYRSSENGQDSVKMKSLIQEAITSKSLKRSYNAIKMRVYNYQSVDNDVSVDGLRNAGKGIAATIARRKSRIG